MIVRDSIIHYNTIEVRKSFKSRAEIETLLEVLEGRARRQFAWQIYHCRRFLQKLPRRKRSQSHQESRKIWVDLWMAVIFQMHLLKLEHRK